MFFCWFVDFDSLGDVGGWCLFVWGLFCLWWELLCLGVLCLVFFCILIFDLLWEFLFENWIYIVWLLGLILIFFEVKEDLGEKFNMKDVVRISDKFFIFDMM